MSRRKLGGGDGARGFWFDAAPAYGAAADGFFYGAEEDYVHELAIVEALQEHGDEQSRETGVGCFAETTPSRSAKTGHYVRFSRIAIL